MWWLNIVRRTPTFATSVSITIRLSQTLATKMIMPLLTLTNWTMKGLIQLSWGDIWKYTLEKKHTNATNAIMHLFTWAIWGPIWKVILVKKRTNATNATMPLFGQLHWGYIWKLTLEKKCTNATNATMHLCRRAIWGPIWKLILVKNRTNATNATMPLFGQLHWGDIWKLTLEKSRTSDYAICWGRPIKRALEHWKLILEKHHTNATNATIRLLKQAVWGHILNLTILHLTLSPKEPSGVTGSFYRCNSIYRRATWLFIKHVVWLIALNAWVACAFDHDFPDRFTCVLICLIFGTDWLRKVSTFF